MDGIGEEVFSNEVFTVVKGSADQGLVERESWPSNTLFTLVARGETRYWILDKEGNPMGGSFCERYGCRSFTVLGQSIIAVELTTNCWRVITPDGRCRPSESCTRGDISSIGGFQDDYVELNYINGITSHMDLDGKFYMKTAPGEYVPVPEDYSYGMLLPRKACIMCHRERGLQLFDACMRPIRGGWSRSVFFKSFDRTSLSWAVVLKECNYYHETVVLNTDTLTLNTIEWRGLKTIDYRVITDKCLHLTCHTEVESGSSGYWNNHYDKKDCYAVAFYNGRLVKSTADFSILDNERLIVMRQEKNNGCYSFDGEVIFDELYDEIVFDESSGSFRLTVDGRSFVADSKGCLQVLFEDHLMTLPGSIATYERISDKLYKVGQYRSDSNQWIIGQMRYGILDVSTLQYRLTCRYSSLVYLSDSIVIVCGDKDHSWGIVDIYGGQRMPMVFSDIQPCADGSFLCKAEEYFSVDSELTMRVESEDGDVRIPAFYTVQPFYGKKDYGTKYYNFKKFHRGFCVVSIGDKYGLIDKYGDEVIDCAYDAVYCIYESEDELFMAESMSGIITVRELYGGSSFFVKADAVEDCYRSADGALFFLISQKSRRGLCGLDNGLVFENKYSRIVPSGKWDSSWSRTYPPGNILLLYDEEFGQFALARIDGTILTGFDYRSHYEDSKGLIVCNTNESYNYQEKHIAIYDNQGRCIVPLDVNAADYEFISDSILKVSCSDPEHGCVFKLFDLDGNVLTTQDYSYIGQFMDGEALINVGGYVNKQVSSDGWRYGVRGGLFGVISSDYRALIEPKYTIVRRNYDGLRVVSVNNGDEHLYGVVTHDGVEVIECKYKYLGDAFMGQFLYAVNGHWASSGPKREALFTADRRNRWLLDASWGILDKNGRPLVPACYQYIYRPIDGISIIVNDNKYGFYNYEEKMFFIPQYDYLEAFSEGLCVVGTKDSAGEMRYGYVDNRNHIVIECSYLKAFHFKDGKANVETDEAYCTIDKENHVVHSQNKAELNRWRAEEEADRARAEAEEEDRRQMIEDGLREAYNGDMSNGWNND